MGQTQSSWGMGQLLMPGPAFFPVPRSCLPWRSVQYGDTEEEVKKEENQGGENPGATLAICRHFPLFSGSSTWGHET